MSNKLLKKVLKDVTLLPPDELTNLIREGVNETDMLRLLLDNLDEAHLVLDEWGTIRYFNATFFKIFPRTKKLRAEVGIPISSILNDKDILAFIENVISGKEKAESKDFYLEKGGEVLTIRTDFRLISTDENDYLDIIFRDITDRVKYETRLRRTESLASMTTMAASIAHEIKNPLAAMKIHLQLLEKAASKTGSISYENATKYLAVLDEEIEHLNSIAVDFLFAVKPMNTELRLSDLNPLIEDIVSFLSVEADERNIKIDEELSEYLPRILIDQKYVRQAILNLVENAFYAMKDGGTLTLRTYQNGDLVVLVIQDTGCGIAEDKLTKIFEPYFSTKETGTGLGLTTVYKVVKEHGGDIHVKSKVGVGTTFCIELPVPKSQRIAIEENINEHDLNS